MLTLVRDIQMLFIFAVLFGLFDYSTVPVTVSLAASHLGKNILGLAMGLIAAGHAFGAAIGAFLGGYLFDLFAHYDEVWLASVIIASLAGLMIYLLPETRGRRPEAMETPVLAATA
jgi:MFS family permease